MNTHPLSRKVSLSGSRTTTTTGPFTVSEILSQIRDGRVEKDIARLREAKKNEADGLPSATTEVDSDAIKLALPGILFAGVFSERNRNGIKERSGLVVMDLDHVGALADTKKRLKAVPQTLACFTSPSGDGIKVLFHGDPTRGHLDTFLAAKKCLGATGLGDLVDDSGKDVARLCFMSFDPGIFVNHEALPLDYEGIERSDPTGKAAGKLDPELPGDDYDLRGDFPGLLTKHGWSDVGGGHWRRPGKDDGASATLNLVSGAPNGFYVFTSSAKPLESGKTYRPWKVLALLDFAGNEGETLAWLTAHGFGGSKAVSVAAKAVVPAAKSGSSEDISKALSDGEEVIVGGMKASETKQREFGVLFSETEDPLIQHKLAEMWKKAGLPMKVLNELGKQAKAQVRDTREKEKKMEQAIANEGLISETQNSAPVFYCEETEKYYHRIGSKFMRANRQDTLLELNIQGLSREQGDYGYSPAEEALNRFQKSNGIDAAGPLCGRPAGLHVLGQGLRFLATKGPTVVRGIPGEFPTIRRVLETLCGVGVDPDGQGQFDRLVWWLKLGRIALKDYAANRPGHALFLIGPKDVGKTLIQARILRPLLGGREANPMGYMTDRTTFNSDLWKAELLSISDGVLGSKPSYQSRELFKGRIKELVANETQPYHAKGKEQMHLTPIWRIVLSFNTDHSSMQNIPAISEAKDDSFSDKVLMFLCHRSETPFFDSSDSAARGAFEESIKEELPAFAHFVDAAEVPPQVAATRLGFKAWCHPWVMENLHRDTENPAEQIVTRWLQTGDVMSGKMKAPEGTRGVLARGTIAEVYASIKGFLKDEARDFERVCTVGQLEHVLKRLMATPEFSGVINDRVPVKTTDGPRKRWRVCGVPRVDYLDE